MAREAVSKGVSKLEVPEEADQQKQGDLGEPQVGADPTQ